MPAPGAIGEVERETAAWVHWYNTRRPTSPWAASHHNKQKTNTQRHEGSGLNKPPQNPGLDTVVSITQAASPTTT